MKKLVLIVIIGLLIALITVNIVDLTNWLDPAHSDTPDERLLKEPNYGVCIDRPEVSFDSTIITTDSTFIDFYAPIDSIEELINGRNKNIDKTVIELNGSREVVWKNKGVISKMRIEMDIGDYISIMEYYVLDRCNWMLVKNKEYKSGIEAIPNRHIVSFKDSTMLNSLVSVTHSNFEIYQSLMRNQFSLASSSRYYSLYTEKIKLYE